MIQLLSYPGTIVLALAHSVGAITILLSQTLYQCFIPPYKFNRVLLQAKRVGPGSFFIVILVAFFIGMIISLQMAHLMVQLSAQIYIPSVVAIALTRELAPVLTALILAGRMGAGMTAEIGSMTVSEQIEALKAFAVNPVKYLVVPRFLAMILMLPLLTVIADLVGIFGGYVICVFKLDVNAGMYMQMVSQALKWQDVVSGLIKTIFFGGVIALIGCYHGLTVKGGADGVGLATTRSVVISFILIIMTDCLFTTMFYFLFKW